MMTGTGPFCSIEMGGVVTVVKVRENLAPRDYRDPGWYKHSPGTVAYAADADPKAAPTAPASRGPKHHH